MVSSIDRSRRILTHLAVVLTCLMAACGGDANRRVMAEVDTIGGVVLVRNGTGLWRKSEEWGVVEEFRVGSAWGSPDEEPTSGINSVTLGPNGQIFPDGHALGWVGSPLGRGWTKGTVSRICALTRWGRSPTRRR